MTPPFSIRRALAEDVGALARLLTPLGYPLEEGDVRAVWPAFDSGDSWALVIEEDGRLVGAVTLHLTVVLHRPKPVGRITSLIVDETARGRGFGRALMRAAEESLAAAGCGLVEVTSHRRRTEAHRFYRHLGYEETSRRFMKVLDPE